MRYKVEMKIPKRIQPLVDDGLVDEVIRRLKSGKEADVYVVRSGDDIRCAKVYKDAAQRSFKQARITSYNVCYTKLLRYVRGPDRLDDSRRCRT